MLPFTFTKSETQQMLTYNNSARAEAVMQPGIVSSSSSYELPSGKFLTDLMAHAIIHMDTTLEAPIGHCCC